MPVRLKGVKPKDGEVDRRYYMIDVQEQSRRERISSGTRKHTLATQKEQLVLDALREDINVPKATLIALVRGEVKANTLTQKYAKGITLKEAFKRTLEDPAQWALLRSRKDYAKNGRELCIAMGEDKPVAGIKDSDIEAMTKFFHEKKNSPATINRKIAALRVVLKDCLRRKEMASLPLLPKLKGESSRKFVFDVESEARMFRAVESLDLKPMGRTGGFPRKRDAQDYLRYFMFLLATGMRPSEPLRIKPRDINFAMKTVTVRSDTTQSTKSGRTRVVPLTDVAVGLLELLKGLNPKGPFAALNLRRAETIWGDAKQIAGLGDEKECVIHSLRHTCATRILEITGDIKAVQLWLGHSDIATTANVYAHVTNRHMGNVAEQLNRAAEMVSNQVTGDSVLGDRDNHADVMYRASTPNNHH